MFWSLRSAILVQGLCLILYERLLRSVFEILLSRSLLTSVAIYWDVELVNSGYQVSGEYRACQDNFEVVSLVELVCPVLKILLTSH